MSNDDNTRKNFHDKDVDESAKLLKKTLGNLKIVRAKEAQTNVITGIHAFLHKLRGTPKNIPLSAVPPKGKIARFFYNLKVNHYEIYDFIRSTSVALVLAIIIRSFVVQPFNIPSESMLPTLLVGDYIFVSKYSYGYSDYSLPFAPNLSTGRFFAKMPQRGDVAVFRVVDDGNKDYIKRIVGLPGDKIIYKNGRLFVNDQAVPAEFAGHYANRTYDVNTVGANIITERIGEKTYNTLDVYKDAPYDNTDTYIVPQGHFFMSGDNRDNSQDSRFKDGPVGFVPFDRLIGRAEFIFFSLDDASFLEFWKWPISIRFNRIFKKIE